MINLITSVVATLIIWSLTMFLVALWCRRRGRRIHLQEEPPRQHEYGKIRFRPHNLN